jgi:hypothetical protein
MGAPGVVAPRSPVASAVPKTGYGRSYSPRHVNDYKHCVTSEPELVRPSRRTREDTYSKIFGKADSPRGKKSGAAAAAAAAAAKVYISHKFEDTQQTLFGPPPQQRPLSSSRGYSDTHRSLFGPPPVFVPRRNRAMFQDAPDLLCHHPPSSERDVEKLQAIKGRYPLRYEDTTSKLFGGDKGHANIETQSTASSPRETVKDSGSKMTFTANKSAAAGLTTRPSCLLSSIFPTNQSLVNWNNVHHANEPSSLVPPPAEPVVQ